MLTHFVIVLRHLRTPPERPSAFRTIALSSAPKLPIGYCSAILALAGKLWLAVPYARRKNASAFSALLVVSCDPRGTTRYARGREAAVGSSRLATKKHRSCDVFLLVGTTGLEPVTLCL